MNPAIAKLTPWLMEQFATSLQESGLVVTEVIVNAMTSWTQFYKNIPMGLIVPLRSVSRMAMAVPSAAVTATATSFKGNWA